jgi:hypothetical protein
MGRTIFIKIIQEHIMEINHLKLSLYVAINNVDFKEFRKNQEISN